MLSNVLAVAYSHVFFCYATGNAPRKLLQLSLLLSLLLPLQLPLLPLLRLLPLAILPSLIAVARLSQRRSSKTRLQPKRKLGSTELSWPKDQERRERERRRRLSLRHRPEARVEAARRRSERAARRRR